MAPIDSQSKILHGLQHQQVTEVADTKKLYEWKKKLD